jgi:hypothetical protein
LVSWIINFLDNIPRKLNKILAVLLGILFWYSYKILNFPFRQEIDFNDIGEVDRIDIVDNNSKPIKSVTEPIVILQVMNTLKPNLKWDLFSIVIAPVQLRLYLGDKFLTGIGFGSSFVTVQIGFNTYIKDVSKKQIRSLCSLLEIEEYKPNKFKVK